MSSNIKLDFGNLSNTASLLKIAELVCGAICYGITIYYSTARVPSSSFSLLAAFSHVAYFLLVSYALLFVTFLVVVAILLQGEYMQKTVFEPIIGVLGFLMYVTASITLLAFVFKYSSKEEGSAYGASIAAAVIGFLNAGLYLTSFFVWRRSSS